MTPGMRCPHPVSASGGRRGPAVDGQDATVGSAPMLRGAGEDRGDRTTSRRPMSNRLDHRRLDRRRLGWRRLVPVLLLLALAVVAAGCAGYVEGGGGGAGKAPAGLATSKAERASWPDPPEGAVAAKVQRVVDGDTFVAT